MGWEYRGGCGPYYYRVQRIGGRVVKQYFGRGQAAELAYLMDQLERMNRAEAARKFKKMAEAEEEIESHLDRVCLLAEMAAWLVLAARGYHYHRGEWRKKRVRG